MMPILREDIIVDKLLMSHAKSICRFRCVCKQWYKLFTDPDFIKTRLKHNIKTDKLCFLLAEDNCTGAQELISMHITKPSSLYIVSEEDDHCEYVKMDSPFIDQTSLLGIDIVGSCNGLILMKRHDVHGIKSHWLWNLSTKDLNELLIPEGNYGPAYFRKINPRDAWSIVGIVTYGVGYNWDTNDYTIVVATCYLCSTVSGCEVQVYKLKSNSWKVLPNIIPYQTISMHDKDEVVFVSGAFHWIARPVGSRKTCIVSFDIRAENFIEVSLAPQVYDLLNDKYFNHMALGVLGGCLCITRTYGEYIIEVWVMKDYNVTESWTRLFTVRLPEVANPINFVKLLWEFKNGEVLFVTTKGHRRNCGLVFYDPVSQICKVTEIGHVTRLYRWNMKAYVERSLVSHNQPVLT